MSATSVLELSNRVKKPPVSSKMEMVIETDHVLTLKQRIKNQYKEVEEARSFS